MPKTPVTIEQLDAQIAAENEQIANFEGMLAGLPETADTATAREYFTTAIKGLVEKRDGIAGRKDKLAAEAAVEKYRDTITKGFGFTNVSASALRPKSFTADEVGGLVEETELRIVELQDSLKIYKRAAKVVTDLGLSEAEVAELPRFTPVVSDDGTRATLTLGNRAASAVRSPRAAEVIVSAGVAAPEDVPLVDAQIHGEPVEGRVLYSSWFKLGKMLKEQGAISDEQWAVTQAVDGKPRQMGFKEFLVKTFELEVAPA